MTTFKTGATAVGIALLFPTVAAAQNLFIYPEKGQSADQQAVDKSACAQWATQETGFNPSAPPPTPAAAAPQGGLLRGAARGALIGTAVGAIAGDTGQGAAIGAAAGGLGGAMRRRDSQMQSDSQNQQAAAQQNAALGQYNRAMTACLEGRGYKVN